MQTAPPWRCPFGVVPLAKSRDLMKNLSWILALVGSIVTLALVAWFGIGNVADAVGQIGMAEFGFILFWQCVTFLVLGLAWDAIMPTRDRRRAWVPWRGAGKMSGNEEPGRRQDESRRVAS